MTNRINIFENIAYSADALVQKMRHLLNADIPKDQFLRHGFAWYYVYAQTLLSSAMRYKNATQRGELETSLLEILFSEYIQQMMGGIPLSQTEFIRPRDFYVIYPELQAEFQNFIALEDVQTIIAAGSNPQKRTKTAELLLQAEGKFSLDTPEEQEILMVIREQFQRFATDKIIPHAHEWHLKDVLIPDSVITDMADLGVFGLTIPEIYGGTGLGKIAMCVVSEELSRGYIGVGSLGTRTEIAAELILCGGTEAQKQYFLPKLASSEILPTAVFTEPNTGSDLGSLRTKAVRIGDNYHITGAKTWITHAARSDMMTVLARTDPNSSDWRGLSMFLAEKPRGTCDNPFPIEGLTGGEIPVLGYRGMKEYELSFDNFIVPAKNLLGEVEGQGFKQLMKTFESARIQTAARAIGVAVSAFETGLSYANERMQFGKNIYHFPRIYNKLLLSAAEIIGVKALTYHVATIKDSDKRCDLEAGLAKLIAARVAWSCADNALQIHGGNGFALEYKISRILCDARILNIFEGAAEIQADVIAKRLLEQ